MSDDIYSGLEQLGRDTPQPQSPEEARLERVPNPQSDVDYCVRFTAPEISETVNSGVLPLSAPSPSSSMRSISLPLVLCVTAP